MKVGIVTVVGTRTLNKNIKKRKKKGGVYDIVNVLKERSHDWMFIQPQNIYWSRGQYMIRDSMNEAHLPLKEYAAVDVLYLRTLLARTKCWDKHLRNVESECEALRSLGIPLINSVNAVYRSKDKGWVVRNVESEVVPRDTTSIIPMGAAKTEVKNTIEYVVRHGFYGHRDQLAKPISGHGGRGIMPLPIKSHYKTYIATLKDSTMVQPHYKGDDVRLYYVGDEFCGAIRTEKSDEEMRGNLVSGGGIDAADNLSAYEPTAEQIEEFGKIHKAINSEFSTIDAILLENGDLKFLEINCFSGWKKYGRVFNEPHGLAPKVVDCLEEKVYGAEAMGGKRALEWMGF